MMRNTVEHDLVSRYERLLRGFDDTTEERALHDAYELGRELFAAGFGALDLAGTYRRILTHLLAERPEHATRLVERGTRLFVESLVPFEMTLRGFRDAHEALRASEERYGDLVENANDIIFTTDLDGRFTSVNRAGELLTGYSQATALTLAAKDVIAPEAGPLLRRLRHLKHSDGQDRRARHEIEIITRDGRRVPLEVTTRVVHEGRKPVGLQGIARDITDRRQAESALRYLNQRLEEKVQQIAHALHDEAGQLLASVYLSVAEIAAELPRNGRQRLEQMRALLDQVDGQIRHLAHELRPTILDDLGLFPACEFLAEGVSKRAEVRVRVSGSTGGRLRPDIETALYRLVQEALTNATRHSAASEVDVYFQSDGSNLSGRIVDNGIGFDVGAVLRRPSAKGLGLIGMRERLAAVGGQLSITSRPGTGTSILFQVPLGS